MTNPYVGLSAASLGIAAVALAALFRHVRGTTLLAAWSWAVVALLGLIAMAIPTQWYTNGEALLQLAPLHYAVAIGVFCPCIALFGAKRPQHRAWQWIVLSFWAVMAMPAGEALLFNRGFDVGNVRGYFILILIAAGLMNHLATRFGIAVLLFTAGQIVLLRPYFPEALFEPTDIIDRNWDKFGIVLFGAAGIWLWLLSRPARRRPPLQRLWLDFRNLYGAAWSIRLEQRFNATAEQAAWPVRLGWRGFSATGAEAERPAAGVDRLPPAAQQEFRSLLRRFVSPAWIERRGAE
ncbi:MAG TPA: hypothetical protein VFE24_18325 [Pirellulales bacterium]|jgi:hypothetical protein|nr:hypothetical protein [Pirellulales bacterium]